MNRLITDLGERIHAQTIVRMVGEGRFAGNVYLVGGALRETALGSPPRDYDFVVDNEKDLGVFETLFSQSSFVLGKKPIQTHRIVVKDLSLDINHFEGSIESDCARRDFTINAIAYDVKRNVIIDPLDGLGDLARKVIRFPFRKALTDDPLRMIKAVRHYSVLDGFSLDGSLTDAIGELKGSIHESAPERIKYELDQIVASPRPFEGIKALEGTGLLFELFPDLLRLRRMDEEQGFLLETCGHTIDGFKYLRKYGSLFGLDEKALRIVGYAFLFHDLGKAYTLSFEREKGAVHFFHHEKYSRDMAARIMEGLRFSSSEIKSVLTLIEHHMRIFLISGNDSTERAVRRLVYKMEHLTPLLIVHSMCDMYGSSGGEENESTVRVGKRCADIHRMYYEWKKEPLPVLVNGRDILSLGFRQGPLVGMILADIREKQIAGELKEKSEALEYARSFLGSGKE